MKPCETRGIMPRSVLDVEPSPLMLELQAAAKHDEPLRRVVTGWNKYEITDVFDPRIPVEGCLCLGGVRKESLHRGRLSLERVKNANLISAELPFEVSPPGDIGMGSPTDIPAVLKHRTAVGLTYGMADVPGVAHMNISRYSVGVLIGGMFRVEPVTLQLEQKLRESGCSKFSFENINEDGAIVQQQNTGHYL
jgi:hypothetical protein